MFKNETRGTEGLTLTSYAAVTEVPGLAATPEQMRMLRGRYAWAASYAACRDVLEVACGAGVGLGSLSRNARSVVGLDIDPENIVRAEACTHGNPKVEVQLGDAHQLPFPRECMDLVLLFEAIYYLRDPGQFLREARRVLRPGGTLLLTSVNCEWVGFHRSPSSVRYFPASEIVSILEQCDFACRALAAFPDCRQGFRDRGVAMLRRGASALHLIPRTLSGKQWLKRVFYGSGSPIPAQLDPVPADIPPLIPCEGSWPAGDHKMLYIEAKKLATPVSWRLSSLP
ncbi:MAG: class I SAM-dependent methyltransferase [Bryobacteraceae bacterium]|nr:class I SAM-dependent methyltransferase [Bryobacteraceae bacterium]